MGARQFLLLAAKNPTTDTGKAYLALGIRYRFTEVFVDEIADTAADIRLLTDYLLAAPRPACQAGGQEWAHVLGSNIS